MELRQKYPLKELLRLSKLPRSTYYYYVKQSNKPSRYVELKENISEVYEKNGSRYGYRRILLGLRQKGIVINHKTVLKLMKSLNLRGKTRKNDKYHSYKGEVGKIAENLLNREFEASKPYEKLTTDVTQFKVNNEKIYLSPVMDLYNREILTYSISLSPNLEQIREMLNGLYEKLPETATPIFHSDQGWQYQHSEYQSSLKEHNIVQSMSRKGNCMDNGAMENFFERLKVEMFYGEKFSSIEDFIMKLHDYISYYNNERIILKLKMSPVQYRTHSQT